MNSIVLPITLTIAGAAALIALWLAFRVSQLRMGRKVMVGDGGDPVIVARMRAHANFIEYAPLVLILIAIIELAHGASPWLWAAGIAFIVARILHPFGMDRPAPNILRASGILLTWLTLAALAIWAITIPYTSDVIVTEETVTTFG